MTTEDALLAEIIANPDDDLPRLVYADWLDENGRELLASWVRVQVELKRTMPDRRPWYVPGNRPDEVRPTSKQNLERHIWRLAVESEDVFDWFRVFDHNFTAAAWVGRMYGGDPDTDETDDRLAIVRRGFVDEIRCTLAEWCGGECDQCGGWAFGTLHHDERTGLTVHVACQRCKSTGRIPGIGPQIVRRHPVTRVVLTDRGPEFGTTGTMFRWTDASNTDQSFSFRNSTQNQLPRDVFVWLKGWMQVPNQHPCIRWYASPDVAVDALSDAAIAWAKSQPSPAA